MYRAETAPGEYYHLVNRGVDKKNIFLEERDYVRFLLLILYLQFPRLALTNLSRYVNNYVKHRMFNIGEENLGEPRTVGLVSFCLMPNHFHLLIEDKKGTGISKYMQRALNAYTKYFNAKYNHSGHIFQGPYRCVHIDNNTQLLHTSAYIHLNPRELKNWFKKETEYPWSSLQDFLIANRWGSLLQKEIIEEQFNPSSGHSYRSFIKTSPAKDFSSIQN